MAILFLLSLCCATAAFESGSLDPAVVQRFREGVLADFGLPTLGSYGVRCTDGCPLGHSIGQLVRLPFHDAAGGGGPNGLGGPNGCIDYTAEDNAGLEPVVTRVVAVRDRTAPNISRADAFVLAGNLAIEIASTVAPADVGNLQPLGLARTPPVILPFRSGRVDAASCSGVDAPLLPLTSSKWSGSLAAHSISSVFGRMGLSAQETVALFGAHTVGRLTAANSGINGVWVKQTSASFSNRYYRDLVDIPWTKNAAQSDDVWITGPPNAPVPGIMLRTDVEIIFNTTTAAGAPACPTFNLQQGQEVNCPRQAATLAFVQAFASNQATWQASFSVAWTKMVEFNVVLQPSNSTSPTPSPAASTAASGSDRRTWVAPLAAAGATLASLLLLVAK